MAGLLYHRRWHIASTNTSEDPEEKMAAFFTTYISIPAAAHKFSFINPRALNARYLPFCMKVYRDVLKGKNYSVYHSSSYKYFKGL